MRLSISEGKQQKLEHDFSKLKQTVVDLQNQQMSNNILIYGLPELPRENCRLVVINFFNEVLKISDQDIRSSIHIDVTHRIGPPSQTKPRQMLVKFCDKRSKVHMYEHVKNLKNTPYSISDQLASATREKRIAQVPAFRRLKQEGSACKLVGDKLIKGRTLQDPKFEKHRLPDVHPVKAVLIETFTTAAEVRVFNAYALTCEDVSAAAIALSSLFQEQSVVSANHRVYAYKIGNCSGWDDDGEYGAGSRLYDRLSGAGFDNFFVCVTRVSGGVNLGNKRFDHICNVACDAVGKL